MLRRLTFGLAMFFALQNAPASAANLVVNGEFDTDAASWNTYLANGSVSRGWDNTTGSPAIGSLVLSNDAFTVVPPNNIIVAQCMPFSASQIDFFVRFRVVRVGNFFGGGIYVTFFAGPDCTGINDTKTPDFFENLPDGWTEAKLANYPVPAGTQSVQIRLQAAISGLDSSGSVYYDHVTLGPAGTVPVTLQSFDVN